MATEAIDEPILNEAEMRERIRQRLDWLRPNEAALACEFDILVQPVIDEIMAQCKQDPKHADMIIASSMLPGKLYSGGMQAARERVSALIEALTKSLQCKDKKSKKVAFKVRFETSQIAVAGMDIPLSVFDQHRIEVAVMELFNEDTAIPSYVSFVPTEQGYMVRINLDEAGHRFVMVPTDDIRLITVATDAKGEYQITELSMPVPAWMDDPNAARGEVHFRRRELIWGKSDITNMLGYSFATTGELSEILKNDPLLTARLYMAYQAQQQEMLEERLREMELLKQCLTVEDIAHLPDHLVPDLPEAYMLPHAPRGILLAG